MSDRSVLVKLTRCEETPLVCSSCGAPGHASCACGVAYVPAASKALAGIAETPQLSDRSIAQRIGVNQSTVTRARKATDARASVEKRLGADGKERKLPRRKLKRVTVESSIDPMFMKISELAAIMDTRSAQSVVAAATAQFERGIGFDRTYIERLTFIRDWLDQVITGSAQFVVSCNTTRRSS